MKGKLTITRSSNDTINIILEDVNSSIDFLRVEITPEEFALAITNFSCRPCEFKTAGLSLIGKTLEVKSELVEYKGYKDFEEYMPELVKPYEVNGWKADTYDLENHNGHKIVNNQKEYKITFRRYV
jgi:hypothetical protein